MTDQEILTAQPDKAFVETTSGESVSGQQRIIDDNQEKEATLRDPAAGASSTAPASSGIPSAMTQHRAHSGEADTEGETSMADHAIPHRQNLNP